MGRIDKAWTSTASTPLRKGPWVAAEDEVLIEYVREHGPRDWSSIRSKGLLPRSGKSCRLRWVNKLKPDLKTGCKFSPEEERVVIDLQAQFGNKWARIATYLPGRTDNDVKNFWSTRQKRLARLLRAQSKPNLRAARGKSPTFRHKPMASKGSAHQVTPGGEQYCSEHEGRQLSNRGTSALERLKFEATVASSEPCSEIKPCILSNPPPPFSSLQLPQALLDLPLLLETHHLATEFEGINFEQDALAHHGLPGFDLLADGLPCLELRPVGDFKAVEEEVPTEPDGFFGDFPVDMLDSLNPPASFLPQRSVLIADNLSIL